MAEAPQIRLIIDNEESAPADDRRGGRGGGGGTGGTGASGEDHRHLAVFGSEDWLGVRLSERLGPGWRATPDGDWYQWNGQRWELDRTSTVRELSRNSGREACTHVDDAKLARRLSAKSSTYAAVSLAGHDPRHVTEREAFDADAWALNTPDGIVDLRTGGLRAHDAAALMTRITKAGPSGECPRFLKFLEQATNGDASLQQFLQRVAGYCLTGSIEEHAIFFLYDNGLGGTGKSTFVTVISELLADYAAVAGMDLFTVATGERHPVEYAILFNVRLVTASETEEGRRWDEARLKAITGGEPITTRYMRGNPFTFRPQFKLLMSGNHRPRMRSADGAMRRRFHMIPFLVRPAKPDHDLLAKLREEYPGILKWAIAGELERRRLGLAPPKVVVDATDEYFEAENPVGRWIDERCERAALDDTTQPIPTRSLYRDFKAWAQAAGEFVLSERVFSQKLRTQRGVEWVRTMKARGFRGLKLKPGEL